MGCYWFDELADLRLVRQDVLLGHLHFHQRDFHLLRPLLDAPPLLLLEVPLLLLVQAPLLLVQAPLVARLLLFDLLAGLIELVLVGF